MFQNPWTSDIRNSLTTTEDLLREGLIQVEEAEKLKPVLDRFQFALPRYYADLIDRADPLCPIRRQAIPDVKELDSILQWNADPLQDLAHQPVKKVTHRYRNRALLHLTSNCSMYCRYCFRKSLLNEGKSDLFGGNLDEAFEYLQSHSEIEEVILSGGDPLMLGDEALLGNLHRLSAIPHVQRIRLHTRVPVTFPQRVTEELVERLLSVETPLIFVTHFNHPREITPESRWACANLKKVSASLLNQSVLLRGVNADSTVLGKLSRLLFSAGVLPYYLHHPDKSAGTESFDVSFEEGTRIYLELKRDLPGYLVPRYVVDEVGRGFKTDVVGMGDGGSLRSAHR